MSRREWEIIHWGLRNTHCGPCLCLSTVAVSLPPLPYQHMMLASNSPLLPLIKPKQWLLVCKNNSFLSYHPWPSSLKTSQGESAMLLQVSPLAPLGLSHASYFQKKKRFMLVVLCLTFLLQESLACFWSQSKPDIYVTTYTQLTGQYTEVWTSMRKVRQANVFMFLILWPSSPEYLV